MTATNVFGDAPIYQQLCLDMGMVPDLPPQEREYVITGAYDMNASMEISFDQISPESLSILQGRHPSQLHHTMRATGILPAVREASPPDERAIMADAVYSGQLVLNGADAAEEARLSEQDAWIARLNQATPRHREGPMPGPADLPAFPLEPQKPGEPVLACPRRKCKLPQGHHEGVHGTQAPRRTMLGRPVPNRAQRRGHAG